MGWGRRRGVRPRSRSEDNLIEVLELLAVRPRLRMVLALLDGERRVADLALAAGVTPVGASQHLAELRRAWLVTARPVGAEVFYRVNADRLSDLRRLAGGS